MTPLVSLFSQPRHLPSVPEVVHELLDTFNQADPDLLVIASKISCDPVITARLLGLANAARFGNGRVITSVREACIRLGLATVRNLVLACGLTQSVSAVPGIQLTHYWNQVFTVAELAKRLARRGNDSGDLAYTAGLLHALGRLVLHLGLPLGELQKLMRDSERDGELNAQHRLLGYTYATVGAELAQRWKLPPHLVSAIGEHLQPLQSTVINRDACIVHLALWLATQPTKIADVQQTPPADWPLHTAHQVSLERRDVADIWLRFQLEGHGLASLLAA